MRLEQHEEITFCQSLIGKHRGVGLDIVVYGQRHQDQSIKAVPAPRDSIVRIQIIRFRYDSRRPDSTVVG